MANSGVVVVVSGKDDTEAVFKQIESSLGRVANRAHETEDALGQLGERATKALEYFGLYASIEGVIDIFKELIGKSAELGAELEHLSQKTGISVENLSVMKYAAEQNDVSLESLAKGFKKLSTVMLEAEDGLEQGKRTFDDLGITQQQLIQTGGDLWKVASLVADRFAAMPDGFRKNAEATALFGRAGADLIPLLNQGSAAMEAYQTQAQALGLVLDEDGAKKLDELHKSAIDAQAAMEGMGLSITSALAPALEKVAGLVDSIAAKLQSLQDRWGDGGKGALALMGSDFANLKGDDVDAKRIEGANRRDTAKEALDRLDKEHAAGVGKIKNYNEERLKLQREYYAGVQEMDAAMLLDTRHKLEAAQGRLSRDSGNPIFLERWRRQFFGDAELSADQSDVNSLHSEANELGKELEDAAGKANPKKPDDGYSPKVSDKQASKMEAALKSLASARAALTQALDKEQGEQEKAAADARLAALEGLHKRELISDEDFYEKKAALQQAGIDAQSDAIERQKADIKGEIDALDKKKLDGAAAKERDTKVVQLKTKIVELDGQSARLTAEQAKNVGDLASSLDSVADKKQALSDELAAKREAIGGASVDARLKQSRDAFSHKRDDLAVIFGANSAEVANADAVQANAENTIRAQGAEASYSTDAATIAAQKSAIQNAARRGAINGITERQQLIELDREEAAALQPVLAAYEKLAAGGDLAATNKVIELKSKINDLENPINEVAAHGRQQFDSIFESMFDNLDKGQRGWAQLNQQIQHMLLTDAYKAYLEPMVQALAGAAIPNNPRAPHGQVASLGHLGGVGAILGGMIPGLGKIPSVGKVSGGAGDVTVQIINQGTPMESAGAMQKMGGDESGFSDRVISVILKDAETNGAGIQAILGALNV